MLQITDTNFFMEIVADAIAQAELNCTDSKERMRWVNAIAKGVRKFEEDPTFMHWQADSKSLLILSDSNEIYSANGTCSCRAFTMGIEIRNKPFPCWHRSLARLVRLYMELTERPPCAVLSAEVIGDGRETLACGCLFNWSDKFTEEFCEDHLAASVEAEREAWEYLNELTNIHSFDNAPYLKSGSDAKPTKIGNIRI